MYIYNCSKPLSCMLKICAFTACKLYLKKEKHKLAMFPTPFICRRTSNKQKIKQRRYGRINFKQEKPWEASVREGQLKEKEEPTSGIINATEIRNI